MRTTLRTTLRRTAGCLLLSLSPLAVNCQNVLVPNELAITSIAAKGTNLVLIAAVPAGLEQVTLEMRPTLSASWQTVKPLDIPPGGGEVAFTAPKPGNMQFFRLRAAATAASAGVVSPELYCVAIAPLGSAQDGRPGSPEAPTVGDAIFHFRGTVDGSDRIVITRDGVLWEHTNWGWPQGAVTVNQTQWDPSQKNYLTTVGTAKFLANRFSLEAVSLERIKGRDVVALERTNNAVIVSLDDTPGGADEYEFKVHFHPALPKVVSAGASTAATLMIAADIDGSDCLKITPTEATWDHKYWDRPANVRLNDISWPIEQTNVLWNAGTSRFLPAGLDFSTARIISRKGRDVATLWAEDQALWVWFADNPNGSDYYELVIGFGPSN